MTLRTAHVRHMTTYRGLAETLLYHRATHMTWFKLDRIAVRSWPTKWSTRV